MARTKNRGYQQTLTPTDTARLWKMGGCKKDPEDKHRLIVDPEAAGLSDLLARLTAERKQLSNGVDQQHLALAAFAKYQNIKELTREILIELVDHIKVYENGNISVHFKFADELRRIAEYIEINTTDPCQSIKSLWQCVFLIKRNLIRRWYTLLKVSMLLKRAYLFLIPFQVYLYC